MSPKEPKKSKKKKKETIERERGNTQDVIKVSLMTKHSACICSGKFQTRLLVAEPKKCTRLYR